MPDEFTIRQAAISDLDSFRELQLEALGITQPLMGI